MGKSTRRNTELFCPEIEIFNRKVPAIKKKYDVVVVGAGISGLAAAKTLVENGISEIIVLEAQAKPGGRICSLDVGDCHLELGAQWIHGEKNGVFALSKEYDLLTDEYSSEGEGLYLRENGQIIEERLIREVDCVIKDILEYCDTYFYGDSEDDCPDSIGHELLIKFNRYLESCTNDTEEEREIKKDLFDWHVRFQLIDNSCSDLYNLSAKSWGLFKFCGGNDYVNFKNGYSTLIDNLVTTIPENTIFYETPVVKINWTEDISVEESDESSSCSGSSSSSSSESNWSLKITCGNGDTIFSHYVIVTSSLGFLKQNHRRVFSPPLPAYLTEAIEYLDFGVLNKIFLIYDEPWWDAEVKGFQLIWSHGELSQLDKKRHWGKYATGFDVIRKNKPILLGWVGGEGAKIIEELSESDLGREATDLLRKFCNRSDIPIPTRVIRSAWWTNEYVRGGYSHIPVKCDKYKINGSNLAQPVFSTVHKANNTFKKPTILLAGESTHKNYFSTVHGAYESGQNQAQVILQHIQSQSS